MSPQVELGVQLWDAAPTNLMAKARWAERAGFDAISIPDHPTLPLVSPLLASALVILTTRKPKVGPLVLNAGLRHPSLLAREIADLVNLSPQRFELGLGIGYGRANDRFGWKHHTRAERVERFREFLGILQSLLSGERVSIQGRFFVIEGDQLENAPGFVTTIIGTAARDLMQIAADHNCVVNLAGGSAAESWVGGRTGEESVRSPIHVTVQWFEVTSDIEAATGRVAARFGVPTATVRSSPFYLVGELEFVVDKIRMISVTRGITRWTFLADRPGANVERLRELARCVRDDD